MNTNSMYFRGDMMKLESWAQLFKTNDIVS